MNIPGVTAVHAVISPTCRRNRTDAGAFDEAVRRLRAEYEAILAGWRERSDGFDVHLVLTVERKG